MREKEGSAGFAWEKGHGGGLVECRLAAGVRGPFVGEDKQADRKSVV